VYTETANMRKVHATIAIVSILVITSLSAPSLARAKQNPIDTALAAQYFREAETASRRDAGAMWKVPLYGPMFFVDPDTHMVVANQADREGKLHPQDGVYVGQLPAEMGTANTAVHWAGLDWTMVNWPLPEDRQPRLRLMMHECFHRIQPQLSVGASGAGANQLDMLEGRIWLQLEWRALEHALWQAAQARRQAVEDALCFRSFRRSLFPDAAANENALERTEGLAEYTGVKASAASMAEFAMLADMKLRQAPFDTPKFVRSFAYTSGPAYGFLLDARGPNWRQSLTSQSDLGQLLADAYEIKLPAPDRAEATRRAQAYDGDEVIARETAEERERVENVNAARKRFIDGPVLILPPGEQFNYTFNPNAVLAVDEEATLYEGGLQVSDAWGVLHTSNGLLMVRRNGLIVRAQVPAPTDASARPLKGDGWMLELDPGWTVVPDSRAGHFTLKKAQ
jgi:hypothetical protein